MYDITKLPTSAPNNVLPEGKYAFTIDSAEVRETKSDTKYLSVRMSLFNKEGKKCGTFFDAFYDSSKDIPMYKLGRFVKALKLPITGSFTFADLAKLCPTKQGIIHLEAKMDSYDNTMKNNVKVFGTEIYYTVEEAEPVSGDTPLDAAPIDEDLPPFDSAAGSFPEY